MRQFPTNPPTGRRGNPSPGFLASAAQRNRRNRHVPRPTITGLTLEAEPLGGEPALTWAVFPDVDPEYWLVEITPASVYGKYIWLEGSLRTYQFPADYFEPETGYSFKVYGMVLQPGKTSADFAAAPNNNLSDFPYYQLSPASFGFAIDTGANAFLASFLAYWKFSEAAGEDAEDATGNGVTLTDVGTVGRIAGKIGTGADFVAATPTYYERASGPEVSPAGSFSIVAWVRPDVASGNMCIVDKWNSDLNKQQYHLYYNLSGHAQKFTFLTSSDGDDEFVLATAVTYAPGTAHLVVAVYDSVAQLMKLSIDGGTFVTLAQTAGVHQDDADFTVGTSWQKQSIGSFDGWIDELGLADVALTQDQVTALYNAGAGRNLFA